MKNFFRNFSVVATLVAVLNALPAVATTFNWTGTSGTDLFWATPGNWSPSGPPSVGDTAWFSNNGVTNGPGSAFADNILAVSRTIAVLQYSNNTASFSHNTFLNPGVTLTISNTAAVDTLQDGSAANLTSTITNTISGSGATLVVTNSSGNINIRSAGSGNNGQNSMLDISGLDTFNASIARLLIGGDGNLSREVGTLLLAKTNIISTSGTAPAINIGDNPATGIGTGNSPTNELSTLYLGTTNGIFSDTITVGRSKAAGQMLFNPAFAGVNNPTVYIRGKSSTRVTTFSIGDDSAQTTSNQAEQGAVDFTGGTVDAMIGVNYVGRGPTGSGNGVGTATGTLTIGAGNYDVNTLEVAYQSTAASASPETGTVNLNGGTLVVNTTLELAHFSGSGGASQGTLNVSNGTVTLKGSIVAGGGTSTINFNGGTLNAGFSGAVIGKSGAPITSLSFSNTILNLAPSFAATNIVASTLNAVAATVNTINIAVMPIITNYPVQIPLIQYTTPSGDLTTFVLGSLPSGSPAFQGYMTNDTSINQIYLVLTNGVTGTPPPAPKSVVWNGATNGFPNGNWDTTTTNWISSGVPTNYVNVTSSGMGDNVTFDDTLTGTTNVNLTTNLSPATITLNNNSKNYIFSGSGSIIGATSLTLQGSGALTLAESGGDNFSGGILVSNGTLVLDNTGSAISSQTTVNSGAVLQVGNNDAKGALPSGTITNNGTMILNRSDSGLNVNSVIFGTGSLTVNGTGTVTLSVAEHFTGPTIVTNGTVVAATANTSTLSASSSLTINSNGVVQLNGDNALANNNGTLPVILNAGGTLTGTAGRSSHIPGLLTLNGGTLTMQGSQPQGSQAANGSWDLQGGVAVGNPPSPITSTINCQYVIPFQSGGSGTIFNITNGATPSGIDLLVSGTLVNGTGMHDTGITKNGNGLMALDNNNTYSGGTIGTIINGGTLQLGTPTDTNAWTTPLGTGTVTINTGAILKFDSSVGVTVSNTIADDNSGNTLVLSRRGTNFLAAVNTYSGNTLVRASTLALIGSGSINSSASITLSNATLDVSASASPVSSSGSLSLTNSTFNLGTNLVTSLGNLAVSNSTLIFPLNTNMPNINLTGTLTTGGTTNVINITSVPSFASYPDDIPLIKYAAADSGITNANNVLTSLGVQLPALGNPIGYLTNNAANSSIDLVVTGIGGTKLPPHITKIILSGTNLVFMGTNGLAGGQYVLLTSTNLTVPLANWTAIATNNFDSNGNFNLTNGITPNSPHQFYILSQ